MFLLVLSAEKMSTAPSVEGVPFRSVPSIQFKGWHVSQSTVDYFSTWRFVMFDILFSSRFDYSMWLAGLSEDSDYTSEVNYPLAQHHEANGSASQYLSVAHQYPSPQRSSEISRENSYETNDTSTDQRHWAYDYGGGVGGGGGYPIQVSFSIEPISN